MAATGGVTGDIGFNNGIVIMGAIVSGVICVVCVVVSVIVVGSSYDCVDAVDDDDVAGGDEGVCVEEDSSVSPRGEGAGAGDGPDEGSSDESTRVGGGDEGRVSGD